MNFRYFILFYFLFFTFYSSYSQQFGGTPSSTKWKQVNTDSVRVIFPAGLDSVAIRIASLTNELQKTQSESIGGRVKKVSIVLQQDVLRSNGYVSLGPFRSEFYLTPPQNGFELGAQNWADNLALHEFRHVEQYSNFRTGLSKTMSVLFGENGQALANAVSIPDWFFEGDAVYNETSLGYQGRGRLPFFFNGYRSLYNSDKHYNFMQIRNGSFKNYIPDHYQLGYLLVAYGREKYGDNFWLKVTQDAAAFKPLFYPLQGAVKKYTGLSYDQFVKNAIQFYQAQWVSGNENPLQWMTPIAKKNVVDYKYPYRGEDGSIIVVKSSKKDNPSFYKINLDNRETKIATKDISVDDYFSYNNGKIIYAAFQPDLRWGNRDYSVIKIVDINSGAEKRITPHGKYFSPDIAHDGQTIIATSYSPEKKSQLILLGINDTIKRSINAASNHIYSYPKFSSDDKNIFVIDRNEKGEMAILKVAVDGETIASIVPFESRIIGFPTIKGDTLLYTCSANGQDEIWAYLISENKNYRLASYSTGLYQAIIRNDGTLISSAFTANGYRLASMIPKWQIINKTDTLKNLFVTQPFSDQPKGSILSLSSKPYIISKYPKLFKPFNFHSWNPTFDQPDYSFILYGQNVLNTFQSQVYYTYNSDEKYSRVGYNGIYGGWYVQPIIDINHTWNRNQPLNSDTTLFWNELNASAGFRLPLNLSGGKQYRNLSFAATYHIDQLKWTGIGKQLLKNLDFNYAQFRLAYSGQIQSAEQHILPRWGQNFLFQYRTILTNHTAHQFLGSATIYLPGLITTHNIVLSGAYQSRDTANQYYFTNNFPFSRGYNSFNFPRLWKFGANYHLPLLLPDCGFSNIVFLKRIRANFFFDYTIGKSLRTGTTYDFRTAGLEIYFDTKWWNQQPITFGVRYSKLLDNDIAGLNANQWEFILPISLY